MASGSYFGFDDDNMIKYTFSNDFTNDSRALLNILSKFLHYIYRTSDENFKPKLCTCAQSHALGTRIKFRLEILTINVISGTVYFRDIILESSRNVIETTPWYASCKRPMGGSSYWTN